MPCRRGPSESPQWPKRCRGKQARSTRYRETQADRPRRPSASPKLSRQERSAETHPSMVVDVEKRVLFTDTCATAGVLASAIATDAVNEHTSPPGRTPRRLVRPQTSDNSVPSSPGANCTITWTCWLGFIAVNCGETVPPNMAVALVNTARQKAMERETNLVRFLVGNGLCDGRITGDVLPFTPNSQCPYAACKYRLVLKFSY